MDEKTLEGILTELLRESGPSDVLIRAVTAAAEAEPPGPEFLRRAEEAALAAFAVRRLAAARARTGFQPLPLAAYLERLAEGAGVGLAALWRFLNIPVPEQVTVLSARDLARMGRLLGLSAREMIAHVRLSLLGQDLLLCAQPVSRRGADGPTSALEACEAALENMAADADAPTARRYAAVARGVSGAYAEVEEQDDR